ncbi:AraC family transcriptional regulator [Myxosarcina sp. GI1]|uniref:AraC family transcriptional regulator n=1 Tax=Myxosarcina sp. GI1 TaxID=1541065 RepID=UPI001C1131CA|nr:AraC family transcriptional regulator [Myxosarcina sp. GI1]
MQQAIDYIQAYLNRGLSLAELASVINISPTYFASLFKQAMGISPHQYAIQQRVERAKIDADENGFGDRRHRLTSRLL